MNRPASCLRILLATLALLCGSVLPVAAETFLVAPFENKSHTPDLDWIGESFAEGLTQDLAGSGRTVVTREERWAALERLNVPTYNVLTRASLVRLGEEAGADWLVVGSYEVSDSQVRSQAQLIDLQHLTLGAPLEETAPLERLLDVQARLAWGVLRQIDPRFPLSYDNFRAHLPQVSASAFENYVRGLLAMNREQQVRYFLQAAKLEPSFTAPALRLGELYFEADDYGAAARWLEKIPDDDPLGPEARFFRAVIYFDGRDYPQAFATLAPVAERRPGAQVWDNLGVFASLRGDAETALADFKRAAQADPADGDVYFNLGLHHARRQEWEAAAQAFKDCLDRKPGDTEALFLRARALRELGRTEEADRARQQAVGDNPALALTLERRQLEFDRVSRDFHIEPGQSPRGHSSLEAASARARHVALHLERGNDLLARGQVGPAEEEFTQAVMLDPTACPAHARLGEIYQRQGRVADAMAEWKAAIDCQDSAAARVRLAELLLSRNRIAEAREQVEVALALEPGNTQARALEAQLAARSGGLAQESKRK